MVILVIMVISMPVMVIRMICMYAGDHSASDQHHGDQGTVCMLVISATFGKLLHSEFGSINTLLPPTCVLSSLTNEDSSSPSSLNYFYKYSVLSKLYAG